MSQVLNLVINGLPSILIQIPKVLVKNFFCFKPCYKWITFNTTKECLDEEGIESFKPCYKWITFNTSNLVEIRDGQWWF